MLVGFESRIEIVKFKGFQAHKTVYNERAYAPKLRSMRFRNGCITCRNSVRRGVWPSIARAAMVPWIPDFR
jgi:hypothetical protein